jgi:hypothetical protein
MIEIENALSKLVEHAPAPPPVARVRARSRRRRRRRVAASAILVVAVGGSIAAAYKTTRPPSAVVTTEPPASIISLYGTGFSITTPGYSLSEPRFDATVQTTKAPFAGPPTVTATTEPLPTPIPNAPRYQTADRHELYAANTSVGQPVLAGQWDNWTVEITVDGLSPSQQARLASLVRFRDHDGYLVVDPLAPLHTVPATGTEVAFDGLSIDNSSYPSGCPMNPTNLRTAQGFPVERIGTKAIWCDPHARARIELQPPVPVDTMIEQLRVQVTRATTSSPTTSGSTPVSTSTPTPNTTSVTTVPTSTPAPAPTPAVTIGHWTGREPVAIYFSADAGDIATNLTWSHWSADSALATGTWHYLNCRPNCASGASTPYPVTISLSQPAGGKFTKLVEQTSGPHGFTMTFTAPQLGQGACANQNNISCTFS